MKLFILLSRFPYPLEKGDKLRAYYQIKALSEKHELIICCLTDQHVTREARHEIEQFTTSLHIFPLNKFLIYWNTIKQVLTDKPFQVGYFYQAGIQKKIGKIIRTEQPDHIYCQLIRTTEYVKNIHNIPKTLDFMDALSKGLYRRSEIASGIKKKVFQIEGKRLSDYEHRIFDYFNHHTIISEQDRKFINHPQNKEITVVENGISASFFETIELTDKSTYDLVFTGNMNYPPNIECAEYIVNELLPELLISHPNITVLLSGANPNSRVLELGKHSNVTVTGWVEDIRESYLKGKIFCAPLFIGTGLQNKLLEAMALGLPVITTPLANNALNASTNKEILIANNRTEFVNAIKQLLENKEVYKALSAQAKSFVKSKFEWETSVAKLEKLFNKTS